MARNKKVEILSNDKEVLHPMTDGDCVIFEDGQTLTQKLSEDDSVKYTPEIVNSSPMFKVGEGNTVDYSDNVLDGAYERATLQGQTYVNYIQESSADEVTLPTPFTEYERTQHNTLTSDEEGTLGINLVGQSYVNALQHDSEEEYVVLGESLEFQEKKVEYTNEGQIKSAMLKGQTLVNLRKATRPSFQKPSTMDIEVNYQELNGMGVTINSCVENSWGYISCDINQDAIKPSTKYLVKGSFKNVTKIGLQLGNGAVKWSRLTSVVDDSYVIITTLDTLGTVPTIDKIILYIDVLKESGVVCEALDIVLLEYQEGMENWDIPYFEGMQSVTVSTRLENLCRLYTNTSENPKTGKTFTVADATTRAIYLTSAGQYMNIKPNKKYMLQFEISNLVLDGEDSIGISLADNETNVLFKNVDGTNGSTQINSNGIHRLVVVASDIAESSSFVVKGLKNQWEESTSSLRSLTISNIMCVEYQNGMENWDLPYFEDYQVMKPVQVESVNKNLFDGELEVGTIATADGTNANASAYNQYCRTKNYIKVKPSTAYRITYDIDYDNVLVYFYSSDKSYIDYQSIINDKTNIVKITTPNNCKYMRFRFVNNTTLLNDKSIQLEESSTATEYVPHQSKTTYSWDEVILRKVGDVEDTLDLTTGEWVQRIGEVTLDGSETWKMDAEASANNSCMFYTGVDFGGFQHFEHYEDREKYQLCDKFKIKADTYYLDENCIMVNQDARIYCRILKTQLSSPDVTGFQEWLKTNNVKISTLLAKPIVHKVNLSRPNLQVYDDITHIHTKCLDGTLIPNIYLPSDISYPAILEPGKNYNVCVNHTEVSANNPLKVNVGGTEITMTDSRMTLTTPTTLANSNVSFTGKGNKIKESMLIKNSSLLTRDLPHFNGIGSVQLGKTIENLCSGRYIKGGSAQATPTDALDTVKITTTTQGSYVLEFPILTPLENGKTYFVYAPVSGGGWATYSFVRTYNNSKSYLRQPMGEMMNPQQYIVTIDQSDNQYVSLCIGCHGVISVGTTYTITRPILCEYEPGMENWDWESIGYFTGTKNIGNEFMRIGNKNLVQNEEALRKANLAQVHVTDTSRLDVKPNTSYYVGLTLQNGIQPNTDHFTVEYKDINGYVVRAAYHNTLVSFTEEQAKKIKYVNIFTNKEHGESNVYVDHFWIEESTSATSYVAHKHNSLHILPNEQIPLTFVQGRIDYTNGGSWTNATNNIATQVIRTDLLDLEPNETYRVSCGHSDFMFAVGLYNNSLLGSSVISYTSDRERYITTTKDVHKIGIATMRKNSTNITPSVLHQVRLEKVTDVTLRGFGDVKDELDLTRGEYIQRIGEVVLDGSDDEKWILYARDNYSEWTTYQWRYTLPFASSGFAYPHESTKTMCDKLKYGSLGNDIEEDYEHYRSNGQNANGISEYIYTWLSQSKASTTEELKTYLQSNPITVQYPLATPIVHKVHIGNKNEANTEVAKPNGVFTLPTLYTEQTHIDMTNNGIVPKVQSRDYIAYPVLPMISRTYTLQHNLTGGVSNLTVDLLGRTQTITYQNHKSLVYAPETMDAVLHNELRISGKGKISGVMYIDGGYMDRDIPYIEGMKNAVNPIVKNIGKNLFSSELVFGLWNRLEKKVVQHNNYFCSKELIKVTPNTIIKLSGTAFDINASGNIMFYDKNKKYLGEGKEVWFLNNAKIPSDAHYIAFHLLADFLYDINGTVQIEQSSTLSQYEPYKENICYVDCGEIRLTPDMFEQGSVGAASVGSHYNSDKADSGYRIRTKELIKLEIGEQYVFLGNNDKYKYSVRFYDMDGNKISHSTTYDLSWKGTTPFTILNDAPMCAFFIKKANDSVITVDDTEAFNFQLVKVSEIKQLRSLPNGVHDEIDLETGTYIQRVGEITFNGTESWLPGYATWDNKRTYYNNSFVDIKTWKGDNGSGQAYYDALRCPQLHRTYMSRLASALIDGVCSYYYSGYQRIFISKQDCATVDELKLWLQENPITVQYELPEPIVKDIVIHNYPHSYEGGHVIIESGDPNTPIPAQLTYRAVTNRSGQIQQHTEQVEKQEREINELETLILANIHLSQTR